jgi:hypothetical protein
MNVHAGRPSGGSRFKGRSHEQETLLWRNALCKLTLASEASQDLARPRQVSCSVWGPPLLCSHHRAGQRLPVMTLRSAPGGLRFVRHPRQAKSKFLIA